MNKTGFYRSIVSIALSVLLICAFLQVFAYDVNGYHISDYDIAIDVGEDNVMYITENITADFTDSGKHGIIRTIPTVFGNQRVFIDDIYVDKTYVVSTEADYVSIRIGDADKTVKGEVKYKITYRYDYGDDQQDAYDKIYHNILGTDWDCDIYKVTFTVNMPKSFDKEKISITYGDRYSDNKYTGYTVSGNSIKGQLTDLSAYQGITLALELPEGYFVNERPLTVYDRHGYHISHYETVIDVGENNIMHITENITADFTAYGKHGIIRTLPTVFEGKRVYVDNIYVDKTYVVEHAREYVSIRIGDADKIVEGEVKYKITYDYDYGDDLEEAYDKIYHNILGRDWDCDVYLVTFTVNMPKPFDKEKISITYGDWYSDTRYTGYTVTGNTVKGQLSGLYSYQSVTLALELPEGYFINERPAAGVRIPVIAIVAPVSVLILVLIISGWNKKGRDEQLVPVPQFYPIEGQSPAEVGYIIDGVINNKDITSLLFYWADKGYLEITEKRWSYEFTRLTVPVFENDYERYMFNKLFEYGDGDTVTTDDLKDNFYSAVPNIKSKLKQVFKGRKELVSKDSLKARMEYFMLALVPFAVFLAVLFLEFFDMGFLIAFILIYGGFYATLGFMYVNAENKWNIIGKFRKLLYAVAVVIMLVLTTVIGHAIITDGYYYFNIRTYSIAYFIVAFVTAISLAYCAAMKKRSEYGQYVLEYNLGFKDFIANAEMDKLKTLIDEDPKYFYNILPYAIVLGLERKWGRKFENIITQPPDWYHGSSMRAFSTMHMLSGMNSCLARTTSSMVQAPSSSSGGGFSSGGFSGGGGGGGGGSSW